MRKLMWFGIGFAAACAVCTYLFNGPWIWILALFCLPAVGLVWIKTMWAKRIAVLTIGLAVGFAWYFGFDTLYLDKARQYDGQTLSLNIEASDYSIPTDYGCQGLGYVKISDKEYPVKYYLNVEQEIAPGDWVYGQFKLRLTVAGSDQASLSQSADGIYLTLMSRDEPVIRHMSQIPTRFWTAQLRKQLGDRMEELLPSDASGLAQALVLADRSHITDEQLTDLKVSGICHIIAASGLHVAILLSLVYMVTGESSRWTALLGVPVLFAFAALVGFTPSVVRACIMQGLMLLSFTLNKEHDPPTALAFSVICMLMYNPTMIASVSLQLSASCIIGIFLFSKRISGYLLHEKRLGTGKGKNFKAKLTRYVAASISVSISTAITTMPLCAVYFGMVSLVGFLTNLLTLWLISFVFYGIMLALLAGAIWMPLGQFIGYWIAWPIRYIFGVAGVLADIPFAAVYTESEYIVIWVILCYVMLSVFFFCKKKRPVFMCAGVILSLVLAVSASCIEPLLDRYRITMLDVGSGQCVLIQSKNKNYMVDCGGDYAVGAADAAAQTLLSQGITRLDGLILTHLDSDHINGVPLLMSRVDVQRVYMPYVPEQSNSYKQKILASQCDIEIVFADKMISDGPLQMHVMAISTGNTNNKTGLCILCQVEDCDILITGDLGSAAEAKLLERCALPKLDVLVAGHHGAKDATAVPLLRQTQPQYALISVGADNHYGHPDDSTLQKFSMFGVAVRRTDLEGTILIRG